MEYENHKALGYQVSLQRADTEAAIIWGTFNALVATNTIVITAMTLLQSNNQFVPILGFLGISVCIIWFLMLSRQFAYYNYWYAWARVLESELGDPGVKIIELGKDFSDGKKIQIRSEKPFKIGRTGSVRIKYLTKILIICFGCGYAALAIISIRNICTASANSSLYCLINFVAR